MSSMSKVNYEREQVDFETLPKNEQAFRWALFIESEGYDKRLSNKRVKELSDKYNIGLTMEQIKKTNK